MCPNRTPKSQLINMAYKAGEISKKKKEARILTYDKNPNRCVNCGKSLSYEKRKNKFCSHECSATYVNQHRRIKEDLKKELMQKRCKNCGKSMKKYKSESYSKALNREFCCPTCRAEYEQKEYIKRWKNGEETGMYADLTINQYLRNYLLKKAKFKCSRCGWHEINEFTGIIPLQIHHIDGNCTNNKEDNLEVLCPNCHSLTSTYGNANKESKRYKRRKDYIISSKEDNVEHNETKINAGEVA